jgi:hypothetical protein
LTGILAFEFPESFVSEIAALIVFPSLAHTSAVAVTQVDRLLSSFERSNQVLLATFSPELDFSVTM